MPDQTEISAQARKHIIPTRIEGVYKIIGEVNNGFGEDDRGGFQMLFSHREIKLVTGLDFSLAQWNLNWTVPNGVRGIHPDSWDKIVAPITSDLILAIADIRSDSPTFGEVETFDFKGHERKFFGVIVPRGVGNSLCNYGAEWGYYAFLTNDYWNGQLGSGDEGIAWDDPDLNIPWPIKDPILSEADSHHKTLRQRFPDKFTS